MELVKMLSVVNMTRRIWHCSFRFYIVLFIHAFGSDPLYMSHWG